jgi:hypothetical protein
MRVPLLVIPVAVLALGTSYVGIQNGLPMAALVAAGGWYILFMGCTFLNGFRAWRINRHPIGRMEYGEFKQLCQANAEAPITFYDSVYAGNCIPGTHKFVRRTFRGRKSIRLGELLPYCRSAERVKNVAVCKLIQLSKRSALRPTTKEVAI